MNRQEYNGWANRATWNVALWANNDEGCYEFMLQQLRSIDVDDIDTQFAKDLIEDMLGAPVTPDNDPISEVYWPEIVDMLIETQGE